MKIPKRIFRKMMGSVLVFSIVSSSVLFSFAGATESNRMSLRDAVNALKGQIVWVKEKNFVQIVLENGTYIYDVKSNQVYKDGIAIDKFDLGMKDGTLYIGQKFLKGVFSIDGEIAGGKLKAKPFEKSLESKMLSDDLKIIQAKLKSYLAFENIDRQFEGQILIAKGDQVILHNAYGAANIKTNDRADITDTYAIGSVTKQMTAYAIMKLESEGKLNYQAPISKYLKDAPYGDKITVDQLLNHTSGLYDYTEALLMGEKIQNYEDVVKRVKEEPLKFESGKDWSYCNTGYYLLGKIVEEITGESLYSYLSSNVFKPLNMDQTKWGIESGKISTSTKGSMAGDVDQTQVYEKMLLEMAEGAGSLVSTVDDLYLWQKSLYGGKLLEDSALLLMAGLDGVKRPNPNYGYGLANSVTPENYEIGHGGNTIGYTASASYHKDKDVHILILTNKGYFDLNKIKTNILNIFSGKDVSMKVEEKVTLSVDQLKKLEGLYEIPQVLKVNIFVEKDKLMLQGEGQIAVVMEAINEVTFVNDVAGIKIVFDGKDNPKGFVLHQSGVSFNAVKIK